jgi:hypothetical protein
MVSIIGRRWIVEVLDIIQGKFASCAAGDTLKMSLGTLEVTKFGAGVAAGLGVGVGVGNFVGVAGTAIVGITTSVGASVGCNIGFAGAAGVASSPHAMPNIITSAATNPNGKSLTVDLNIMASY